jgi:hypothetical protein
MSRSERANSEGTLCKYSSSWKERQHVAFTERHQRNVIKKRCTAVVTSLSSGQWSVSQIRFSGV